MALDLNFSLKLFFFFKEFPEGFCLAALLGLWFEDMLPPLVAAAAAAADVVVEDGVEALPMWKFEEVEDGERVEEELGVIPALAVPAGGEAEGVISGFGFGRIGVEKKRVDLYFLLLSEFGLNALLSFDAFS